LALRGISIPKSFLWFRDCSLFGDVRLLDDRRSEARADFQLELSAKGTAAYEREARRVPREDIAQAERAVKAAFHRRLKDSSHGDVWLTGEQRIAALPEANDLWELVTKFRETAIRKVIANAHRGPRPKLVKIEFGGESVGDDEYDPLRAPKDLYIVVDLPRRADPPGGTQPGPRRLVGYAPAVNERAIEKMILEKYPKKPESVGDGEDSEAAVGPDVGVLEDLALRPDLSEPDRQLVQTFMMHLASEPVRLVPTKHRPMLAEAFTAFMERLSYAKIAQRLNEKGYRSQHGMMFSAPLAEHVVIQALLMLGASEFGEFALETDS
jgi:hypothetical protein